MFANEEIFRNVSISHGMIAPQITSQKQFFASCYRSTTIVLLSIILAKKKYRYCCELEKIIQLMKADIKQKRMI